MTKLLQSQTPSLPPHIIAQQTLPSSKPGKVMAKPPGPVMSNLRPVQSGVSKSAQPQGIQTVNKKSLNTVLDRLGGLGTVTSPVKSSSNSPSLVQQLQAPPMSSRPAGKTSKNKTASNNPSLVTSLTSGPPIAQPMVQFPDATTNLLQQSLLLGPNPAAAQAALMMAGLNGLSPVQAQQAMQELLQQQLLLPQMPQQASRLRAPPPLKNMAMKKPE